jgi:hypothetical protein
VWHAKLLGIYAMKKGSHTDGRKFRKWPLPIRDGPPTATHDIATPSGLYATCMDHETSLETWDLEECRHSLTEFCFFLPPLFDSGSSEDERRDHGYPFYFSICGPESKVLDPDWRYQQLLRLLKQLDDAELRWLLLARWLHEESVCASDELLPSGMLQRLIDRYEARNGELSKRDYFVWHLITVWQDYFSTLANDARKMSKTARGCAESLAKLGYDPAAIHWTLVTRSLVRAITSWLEERNKGDARSLENAYSRARRFVRNLERDS